MGRIAKKFHELRAKKEKALIVYLTAGDPSLAVTRELILGLEQAGMDMLEIGVPFSDPTADGPVIQEAAQRSLKSGTTLAGILQLVQEVRQVSQVPIVLFGYFNPIFAYGVKKFARAAQKAGIDGVLVVDLPHEEAQELRVHTDDAGIDFISLIAPTTDHERIRQITAQARGFIYYISITGITGTAAPQVAAIKKDVEKIRKISGLPIAVGFGITRPQQAKEIAEFADGIVVGSAVVRMIDENRNKSNLIKIVAGYVQEIKKVLR